MPLPKRPANPNPLVLAALALLSPLLWLLNFAMIGVGLLIAAPFCLFLPFARVQRWTVAPWIAASLRCSLNRVRYVYHPDFRPERVSVYMMNHTSMLDAHAAVGAIPAVFCGLENASHFNVPIYGWAMKAASGIPVPKGEGRLASLIASARERRSRGISILAFPEGHRTRDGVVQSFRTGAFLMAREAGMPVVPMAAHGMFRAMPKGTFVVWPGTITVFVGPQLETEGKDDAAIRELAESVRAYTQHLVDHGSFPDGATGLRRPR